MGPLSLVLLIEKPQQSPYVREGDGSVDLHSVFTLLWRACKWHRDEAPGLRRTLRMRLPAVRLVVVACADPRDATGVRESSEGLTDTNGATVRGLPREQLLSNETRVDRFAGPDGAERLEDVFVGEASCPPLLNELLAKAAYHSEEVRAFPSLPVLSLELDDECVPQPQ